jgi:ABC-type transport system involved in multi-copper enzyme maturation permease subunit
MNLNAVLALFGRSVRDDTRSKTLLWARIGIAVAVLFAILRARTSFYIGGAPGLNFFASVVWMNFVFICIAGMSYFASSITEEKEEGTLGLLRMTDLSPVSILLGKSTSRLIGGLLLLLVQVPFVMLAITLGGIRLDQVLGAYALLGAFLFFACNMGLLGSVVGARTGAAAVAAVAFALIYLSWPFLAARILSPWRAHAQSLAQHFATPALIESVLQSRGTPVEVAGGICALLLGGFAAFVLAWHLFDRFCGDPAERSAPAPATARVGAGPQAIERPRPSRTWPDAVCWRDYYYLHGGTRMAWVKSVLYFLGALWIAGLMSSNRGMQGTALFWTLLIASLALVIFESLFATSRIYRIERKEKTLSTIMALPQDYEAVVKSKQRAIWISLLPGLTVVGICLLVLTPWILAEVAGTFFIWFLQGVAYFVAQLYFNHNLVAWFSLRMKWGGLPLALGISWLGNLMAIFLTGLLFQLGALVVLIIVSVGAAVAMHNAFRRRLAAAATED